MKSKVSTICDRIAATPARSQSSRPSPLPRSALKIGDVEELRNAVGDDAGDPDARRCRPSSVSNAASRSGGMSCAAGRARTRMASSIEKISGTKPISTSRFAVARPNSSATALEVTTSSRKAKIPASTASGPERDLLVAEHAGDADHAAVEDGEGEERARMAARSRACRSWSRRNRFAAGAKRAFRPARSRPSRRGDRDPSGRAGDRRCGGGRDRHRERRFLAEEGLIKGSMQVLDADGATRLYAQMRQARETSGGSAANTMAGVAALGGRAGFVGQVADDQLGDIFAHDIRALGVEFLTPREERRRADRALPDPRHARRAADDEHLSRRRARAFGRRARRGADQGRGDPLSRSLSVALGRARARRWRRRCGSPTRPGARSPSPCPTSPASSRTAPRSWRCSRRARSTCSSPTRRRSPSSPASADREAAIAALARQGAAARRHLRRGRGAGGRGRRAVEVPIARIGTGVVDTTGAGDLFAAGFLVGQTRGLGPDRSLRIGSLAAAEVISHFGARPESDLKALVAA